MDGSAMKPRNIDLRLIEQKDLPFLIQVRNYPSTRKWLDDKREFTLEECERWFIDTRPKWYLISDEETKIGYIRTAKDTGNSIMIGCDIDPVHRNKVYARESYNIFLTDLYSRGYKDIWLRVDPGNKIAIRLYESLGFQITGYTVIDDLHLAEMRINNDPITVDILTIVNNDNSIGYLDYFCKHARARSSGVIDLRLKVIGPADLPKELHGYEVIKYSSDINLNLSTPSHVRGIEFLISKVETPWFCIFDYDTCITINGWDSICKGLMNQCKAFGSEYPAEFKKYLGVPTIFFSMWETETWNSLSTTLSHEGEIDRSLHCYDNLELKDIGVMLPMFYKNIKTIPWPANIDKRPGINFETFRFGGKDIVSHIGRGSYRTLGVDPVAIRWSDILESEYD